MNPKLLIGLGGSGREVLLRVRRKIYEKFNTLDTRSTNCAFLWIDTDPNDRNKKLTGDFQFSDYIDKKIAFNEELEEAMATVELAKCQEIGNARDFHANIWDWADEELFNKITEQDSAITAGAKQVPPMGRFALFANAAMIRNKLLNRIDSLSGDALKIMIVGSLAGGTGAGMCLDVAAMLRCGRIGNVFPDCVKLDKARIWGYFVLPDAMCKDQKITSAAGFDQARVKANGYAMLQELERASIDRENKASILSRGGRMKATWLRDTDPFADDVKDVPLPVYNSITLFDGHGAEPLTKIEDVYELVATLLNETLSDVSDASSDAPNVWKSKFSQAEVNAEALLGSGHIETVPMGRLASANSTTDIDKIMADPDTRWADILSYSFSVAGLSRITFETPRLRLLASYRLAICALECWRGKYSSDFDTGLQGSDDDLKQAVCDRLASAIGVALNGGADPTKEKNLPVAMEKWKLIDDVRRQFKAAALPAFENVTSYNGLFDRFEKVKVYDRLTVTKLLERAWFEDEKTQLAPLARDFVDGLMVTEQYRYQGGIEALSLAAGTTGRQGLLRELLTQVSTALAQRENTVRGQLASTDAKKIRAACDDADKTKANSDDIQRSTFTLPRTKTQARDTARQHALTAYELIEKYYKDTLQAELLNSIRTAINGVLQKKAQDDSDLVNLAKLEESWRVSAENGNSFTASLLNDPGYGLCRVIEGIKKLNPDACTLHLALDIQRDDKLLWAEMKKAFGSIDAIRSQVTKLQQEFLAHVNLGGSFFEMVAHEHLDSLKRDDLVGDLVQFASTSEAITKQLLADMRLWNEKASGDATKLGFLNDARLNERIAKIYELTGKKKAASAHPLAWLRASCTPCAELGTIKRQSYVGGNTAGYTAPTHRHQYIVSAQKLPEDQTAGFSVLPSTDPHQILAIILEVGVPLPNFLVLTKNSALQYSQPASHLHFLPPKTAYPPIHRMSVEEGKARLECAVEALLSVILGQFRPARSGAKSFALNRCRQDPNADHPFSNVTSLGALIYHLGEKGKLDQLQNHLLSYEDPDVSKCEALKMRNEDILSKLNVYALAVLRAICDYNLKWCNKQTAKFSNRNAPGKAEDDALRIDVGPQALVLTRIKKHIEEYIQKRGIRSVNDNEFIKIQEQPRDPSEPKGKQIQLSDWLHHVAEFVPVILDGRNEGGQFLVLRTRCEHINEVEQKDDLLDRAHKVAIRQDLVGGFLALKSPVALYSTGAGAETMKIHKTLSRTPENKVVSMNPYAANAVPNEMLGISEEAYINERVMLGQSDIHRSFNWGVLVPQPSGYWLLPSEHPDQTELLSLEQIGTLIRRGEVTRNEHVFRQSNVPNEQGEWKSLIEYPELKDFLPQKVAVPTAPPIPIRLQQNAGARPPEPRPLPVVQAPVRPANPTPPARPQENAPAGPPPRKPAQNVPPPSKYAVDESGTYYTVPDIARMVAERQVTGETEVWNAVWKADTHNWTPLAQVAELAVLLEENRPRAAGQPPRRPIPRTPGDMPHARAAAYGGGLDADESYGSADGSGEPH